MKNILKAFVLLFLFSVRPSFSAEFSWDTDECLKSCTNKVFEIFEVYEEWVDEDKYCDCICKTAPEYLHPKEQENLVDIDKILRKIKFRKNDSLILKSYDLSLSVLKSKTWFLEEKMSRLNEYCAKKTLKIKCEEGSSLCKPNYPEALRTKLEPLKQPSPRMSMQSCKRNAYDYVFGDERVRENYWQTYCPKELIDRAYKKYEKEIKKRQESEKYFDDLYNKHLDF